MTIHANADNFANIPSERYKQLNGASPPDETTLATGDAGPRVACGVIGAANRHTTSRLRLGRPFLSKREFALVDADTGDLSNEERR